MGVTDDSLNFGQCWNRTLHNIVRHPLPAIRCSYYIIQLVEFQTENKPITLGWFIFRLCYIRLAI
jgi:hypothetical protein